MISSLLALSSGNGESPGLQGSPETDGIDGDPDENAALKFRDQGKVGEQGAQGETGAKSV